MKTSELTGFALDWAVAKCEGATEFWFDTIATYWVTLHGRDRALSKGWAQSFTPSTDWSQGGPVIEQEGITTAFCSGDLGEPRTYWIATNEQQSWDYGYGPYHEQDEDRSLCISKPNVTKGPTPLIAAMRCYVASKLGPEVDVPEELK